MKKMISICAAVIVAVSALASCGTAGKTEKNDAPKIVTTIFPEYDWVMSILGGNPANAEVTLLLDNGTDLHSYQPTAQDLLKISECDLFIYVGGESDEWVEDALKEAKNKDMIVVNLLEALGDAVKDEEAVEGMETEEDNNEAEADEHVWLSLKNAITLCDKITDAIMQLDPENSDSYAINLAGYQILLKALDSEYQSAVEEAEIKTLVFGDRFPFRYLMDDYGLQYYAAFAGCSAETEASFETVIFLANKVDELGLNAVMQTESSDGSVARTICQNTASKLQKILTLDSIQSTTAADVASGTTYLSVMEDNLEVIKEALK